MVGGVLLTHLLILLLLLCLVVLLVVVLFLLFPVAHGLSNSLVLPHVLRFNAAGSNAAAQEYSDMARICFPSDGLESLLPPWPTHLHGADALANGTRGRGVVVGVGGGGGGGGGVGGVVQNIDI